MKKIFLLLAIAVSLMTQSKAQNPYIGQINVFAGNFAPAGWAFCDGSLLPISEYETLFTLIGTTYGGDGESTFALPDLRGRVPINQGTSSANGVTYQIGQTGGTEQVTITPSQMPSHNHGTTMTVPVQSGVANANTPVNNVYGINPQTGKEYSTTTNTNMADMQVNVTGGSTTGSTGGGQPIDNIQPYVVCNYIISLYGIYPSQSKK